MSWMLLRKGPWFDLFELAVISGKGGTGKTLLATVLSAYYGWDYIDCDVEGPNGALLLKPDWRASYDVEITIPKFHDSQCNRCGACVRFCRFQALALSTRGVIHDPELCHGCMGCEMVCEQKAIEPSSRKIGIARQGCTETQTVWEGHLELAEPIAPPLIKELKRISEGNRVRVLDGPPGASCNMIETLKGVDYALLVAESTRFGIHDFRVSVEVLQRLGIPAGVVINRSFDEARELREYIQRKGIALLGQIPFSERIAFAYSQGDFQTLMAELEPVLGQWKDQILKTGGRVKR